MHEPLPLLRSIWASKSREQLAHELLVADRCICLTLWDEGIPPDTGRIFDVRSTVFNEGCT